MEAIAAGAGPSISVIIPSYNTAPLIANCLDSVFAQSFSDFEVVVVNDGSPDRAQLEEALRPYLAKIVYIVQENKRAAGARNTAIGKARGEFFAFLDSDDSWFPDHLASQMELFRKDPGLDLVYADAVLLSDSPRQKTFMEKCPSEGAATFEALVVERCQIPVSTVVARKAAILRAGLFDENLARCDDYDMWLRTAFFGGKIDWRRKRQARLFLGRPDSLGSSRSKMAEAYWKILEKAATTLPLTDAQRKLVGDRAAEIKARYLYEQGKLELHERHPEKAGKLFAEANLHYRTWKLDMAIRSLQLAPQSTCKLLDAWNRFRNGLTV
ncbi:MAG TPA: glycosyltransferase family A protein [Candidatus Sulfotelmatobacter sp.]|nr:glycosyltransferase family A protein [Candidatus Sulfotelmatobacter sp.]